MFKEKSIQDFCQAVGEATPAPGGGSVAALAASLSQSLLLMVAGLSKNEEEEFRNLKEELHTYQESLYELIDKDTQAFQGVMAAWKMPKEKQKEALLEAFLQATQVPLEVMEYSCLLLGKASYLVEKGNQNALSDTGVSALLSKAALEGARYNVLINLPSIKDSAQRMKFKQEMEHLYARGSKISSHIQSILEKKFHMEEE